MFNRPRCREWLPLASQQLRLRNLIKISGHNIVCSMKSKLYFTLFNNLDQKPLYASEQLESHNMGQFIDWPEINFNNQEKANLRSIRITVWERSMNLEGVFSETVIFECFIEFAKLFYVQNYKEIVYKTNALRFLMHGGYFVAVENVDTDSLRNQLSLSCFGINESISNSSHRLSGLSNNLEIENERKDVFLINSPNASRCGTPTLYVNHQNTELVQDLQNMCTNRYNELRVNRIEVYKSYSLRKLLALQELQRHAKNLKGRTEEVKSEIRAKSALCLDLSQKLIYRNKIQPSIGRTLNRLLYKENIVHAEDVMMAQNLQKSIEIASFRLHLLLQEFIKLNCKIGELNFKYLSFHTQTSELANVMQSRNEDLIRIKQNVFNEKEFLVNRQQTLNNLCSLLMRRKCELCSELKDIYTIGTNDADQYLINSIPLPNIERLSGHSIYFNSNVWENISPLTLSVSLGSVAHVVQVASFILDIPLRNPLNHIGSRSRIIDNMDNDLPKLAQEFPLYSRTSISSTTFLHAIYLLNKNVAQLNFDMRKKVYDITETLPNLLHLLTDTIENYNKLKNPGMNPNNCKKVVSNNRSEASCTTPKNKVNGRTNTNQRISRSVGSYSDTDELVLDINNQNCYNSDSGLSLRIHRTLQEL